MEWLLQAQQMAAFLKRTNDKVEIKHPSSKNSKTSSLFNLHIG